MSSNAKPLLVAGLTSLVIVLLILTGGYFLLRDNAPAEDEEQRDAVAEVETSDGSQGEDGSTTQTTLASKQRPKALGTLFVTVVDESTGDQIRNAKLVVQRKTRGDQIAEDPVYQSSKDQPQARGEFRVSLAPGTYVLRTRAPRYSTLTEDVTVVKDKEYDLKLKLSRGLSITGTVRDRRGSPIAGAEVRASREFVDPEADEIERLISLTNIQEMSQEPPETTVTEADGSYQLDGLQDSYYEVTAIADGFTPQTRDNIRPTATGINFVLPTGSLFYGKVLGNNEIVPGARVSVYIETDSQDLMTVIAAKSRPPLAQAVADGDGEFQISSLGAGLYNFFVVGDGFQPGRFRKISIYEGENEPRTFGLEPGYSVEGQVTGPDGEAISGARVRPILMDSSPGNIMFITFDDGSVETDDEGYFSLSSLEAGRYNVLAWHDDYGAKQVRNVNLLLKTPLKIVLPSGGAVSGRITEKGSGQPVEGCRVSVSDLLDLKKESTTDENGDYYIGGLTASKRGRYVMAEATGYARVVNKKVEINEGQVSENQNFELEPTARLSGRVVNSSGAAVQRARVMAKRRGANTPVPITVGSAITNDSGNYTISNLEAGEELWLTVMSSEFLETESEPFSVEPGDSIEAGDLVLTLGGSVAGSVINSRDEPVAGASVTFRQAGELEFNPTKISTTDRRGRFRLKGLTSGAIDLKVTSRDYLDELVADIKIDEGLETQSVSVQIRQGNAVNGLVVDGSGKPIHGATVTAREFVDGVKEYTTETNTDGEFNFKKLMAEDSVQVEVSHAGFGTSMQDVDVGKMLTVELHQLGSMRGLAVDPRGQPLSSFTVQPVATGASQGTPRTRRLTAKTFNSGDGHFNYSGLDTGTYRIIVRSTGFQATSLENISVTDGEETDLGDVTLKRRP